MRHTQVYNPYLPSFEYVPDGEPHVFGERVYLYGSHDRFHGAQFCLNDYVCYSADVRDLKNWRYEGVIYRKEQDPRNQNIPADTPKPELASWDYTDPEEYGPEDWNGPGIHAMWAPDVVRGVDGRYYLYYCLDFLPEIAVAVCDTPAGQYEYLGLVKHPDGTPLGTREGDLIQFDPGVFLDEDGTVYLYSGNDANEGTPDIDRRASQVMRLRSDMLTIDGEGKRLIPGPRNCEGTGFEGHSFFEASSIRKIGERYYLVYSSELSHELCYAVSEKPDEGFRFGGTIVDIADFGLAGDTKEEVLNCYGNTHGGIEQINGKWYVFYHRQTNRTNYSRQACAEEIVFEPDGSIRQEPVTSCGLNGGALRGEGRYPAGICCRLRGKNGKLVGLCSWSCYKKYKADIILTKDIITEEEANWLKYARVPIPDSIQVKEAWFMHYKYY